MTGFWPIVFCLLSPFTNFAHLFITFVGRFACLHVCLLAIQYYIGFLHVFFFAFAFTHPDICMFSFCLVFQSFVCLQIFI